MGWERGIGLMHDAATKIYLQITPIFSCKLVWVSLNWSSHEALLLPPHLFQCSFGGQLADSWSLWLFTLAALEHTMVACLLCTITEFTVPIAGATPIDPKIVLDPRSNTNLYFGVFISIKIRSVLSWTQHPFTMHSAQRDIPGQGREGNARRGWQGGMPGEGAGQEEDKTRKNSAPSDSESFVGPHSPTQRLLILQ